MSAPYCLAVRGGTLAACYCGEHDQAHVHCWSGTAHIHLLDEQLTAIQSPGLPR